MPIIATWLSDFCIGIWSVVGAFALVFGLLSSLSIARKFVKGVVSEALKDPSILASVAALVKPDLVFDENGAVLSDRGAWAAIKEDGIKITKDDSDNDVTRGLPVTIRIAFTKHLPTAPLLTPICPDGIFVISTRGQQFEWVYTLKYSMRCDVDDGPIVRTYRLELL